MEGIRENCMENNTEEYCRRAPLGTLFNQGHFVVHLVENLLESLAISKSFQ